MYWEEDCFECKAKNPKRTCHKCDVALCFECHQDHELECDIMEEPIFVKKLKQFFMRFLVRV